MWRASSQLCAEIWKVGLTCFWWGQWGRLLGGGGFSRGSRPGSACGRGSKNSLATRFLGGNQWERWEPPQKCWGLPGSH
jgi:hypothetical protein